MSNFTTVSGSNITDLKSNKLALGSISFTATDALDQPISFQIGGGGQAVRGPVTSPVIAGVITSFTVPDPASTLPTGIYYRVSVTDSSTGNEVLRYRLVSFTGLTFNFDSYAPLNLAAGAPLTGNSVTGNLSVTGNVAATGTVTGSNIAGGQIATGTGTTNTLPKYTNGASAVLGNSSITDDGTTVSTSEALSVGGQVVGKNGAVGSPSFTFASSLTTGFWRQAADVVGASIAGVLKWLINSAGLLFGSGQTIGFSSNADPSAAVSDTGISRISAASIGMGNGTAGTNNANVQAGSFYLGSGAAGVWGFITSMLDQVATGGVRWSSGANATTGIDTGVTRGGAAATIAVGNGTAGNASGTVKAAKLNNGADLAIPATGANVVSDTATQTLSGKGFSDKVTLYNNITTASNGLTSTVAAPALTGQTANIAATTAYAVPASGAGKYLVTVYIIVTSVGTTSTLPATTITWTDRDNSTVQSATATATSAGNTLTTVASSTFNLSAKASTNIQVSTSGYASTGTPMQYAIRVEVIAL